MSETHESDVEFDVILERNPDTGTWVADVPGVPGAYSQGATRAVALKRVREALRPVKESDGLPRHLSVEFAKVRVEA